MKFKWNLGISNNKWLKLRSIPLHYFDKKDGAVSLLVKERVNIRKREKIGNIEGVSPQIEL
jgi:hypothetical protein